MFRPLSTVPVVTVYVEGSFWQAGFGTPSDLQCYCRVRAGYGVYFPASSNMIEQFYQGRAPNHIRTNNDAEIYAIAKAMELCEDQDARLFIFTDSLNAVRIVGEYNNWLYNNGRYGPVIDELFSRMRYFNHLPELVHVRGHSGDPWNNTAHELAHRGMQESCSRRCVR